MSDDQVTQSESEQITAAMAARGYSSTIIPDGPVLTDAGFFKRTETKLGPNTICFSYENPGVLVSFLRAGLADLVYYDPGSKQVYIPVMWQPEMTMPYITWRQMSGEQFLAGIDGFCGGLRKQKPLRRPPPPAKGRGLQGLLHFRR